MLCSGGGSYPNSDPKHCYKFCYAAAAAATRPEFGSETLLKILLCSGGGSYPEQQQQQLAGPQIPPRSSGEGGSQERVLSVSGKKKCSHCKEELGMAFFVV